MVQFKVFLQISLVVGRGTHAADSHSVGDGMLAMVLNELANYLIRRPSTAQQTYAGIQDAYIFCGTDVLPS